MAASFASAPLLQKNTYSAKLFAVISSATFSWIGTLYKLETCQYLFNCSSTDFLTIGWLCPKLQTPIPAPKSKYSLPLVSFTIVPAADSTSRLNRLYVGNNVI